MSSPRKRSGGGSLSNAVANWINFFVSAVVGLIVNPLLLQLIGTNAFGVWKGTQRVLDLAGVADGRSTQALKWVVAHRHSAAAVDEKRRDVGATMVFSLMMSPVLIIACVALVLSLPLLIQDVPQAYLAPMYWTGMFLAANVVLRGLLMIPDAVLVGTNQGHRSMNLTTVFLVLSNIAMLSAAFAGWGIGSFGIIILVAAIGNAAATWIVVRRRVNWWGIARPDRADVRRVGGFSAWTMGWRAINQSLASIDGVLIGALMGVTAIAQFTFSSYVVTFAYAIAQATTSALMPSLGQAIGAGSTANAVTRVRQVNYVNLWIVTVAGCLVLALNEEFVSLWAGSQMYMGQLFNTVLVACYVQVALTRNSSQIQDAALQIRRRVVVGLVSTGFSIVLAIAGYMLTQNAAGILVGLLLGRLPMTIVYTLEVRRILPGGSVPSVRLATAAGLLVLAGALGFTVPAMPLGVWLAYAVVLAFAFAAVGWFSIMPAPMRGTFTRTIAARLRRGPRSR